MKIRPLTPEYFAKAGSLLDHAFAPSKREVQLFDQLHAHGRTAHEWVCLIRDSVVAYIGFTAAYHGNRVVGLHLGLLAVQPRMQGQGIGSALLRFALRQEVVRTGAVFVLGNPGFYAQFGFERCTVPRCPFDQGNKNFSSRGNESADDYIIGYEPEFTAVNKQKTKAGNRHRQKNH